MNQIKTRHAISIGILFSLGNIILIMGLKKEFIIQAIIFSFIVSFFIILLYQKLLNKYPNMTLFNIIKTKFDNLFGKVIIIIYLLFLIINGIQIIYSFIDFITSINQLDFSSKSFIMFLNFLLLIFILNNSLMNLSRFSQVIFIITTLMITLLFILGVKDINVYNLLPIIPSSIQDLYNSISVIIVHPFLEITLLFNVFSKMKNNKIKNKIFLVISILSMLFLVWMSIEVVGVLGSDYTSYLNYPYYVAISCINMSKIVIRIETLSFVIYYFSSFMKLIFVMHSIMLGFNSLTKIKKKHYEPFLLLMHILSLVLFDNFNELKLFMNYYSICFIVFSVLLIFILLIKKNKTENINIINHYT